MSFDLADFEAKATGWLVPSLRYEGPGTADFVSPVGSVTGPFVATFSDLGEQSILATCEQLSCDPEYGNWGAMAFLSGAKIERENNRETWSFGGLNNPCRELRITTSTGTFTTSDVLTSGMTAQLVVAKSEDVKPIPLQFRVSQGRFETSNPNEPKFFVLPLLNCIAEPGDSLCGTHSLRIYPTPIVPDSLTGKERFMAELAAQRHNRVIGFYLSGRVCFIERLEDYDQRLASLRGGNQCITTAVLVGELAGEPVKTLEEFRSWFPFEMISALGFASGVDVGFSWIEIRDEHGELIRRLHGQSWRPTFDEGDVLLTRLDATESSGMGFFLTHYLACSPAKRAYLEAVMNHARLGSLGTSLRLYDILDHLIRAFECLCREQGFVQQNLLSQLSLGLQARVQRIFAGPTAKLRSLAKQAQRAGQFDDARLLATIQSRTANAATTENKFGLAVVALLKKFRLPDANILDSFIAVNPRPDGLTDWASVITNYRNATIHEGYMDFDKKHDAADVVRICANLKDLLTRIILKEVGYAGTYESVLRRSYGPQAIEWIGQATKPAELGFC